MGTVVDKLNYLKETKTAIKNALVEKGVEVADSDTFRSYAQKVVDIPTSGGDIDALIDRSIIEISSNVTSIGSYAFAYCSALTSVSFPLVTSIGGRSFFKCSALKSVSFPVATSIGDYAFNACSALTSVSFPRVTSIGTNVFTSCSALKSVSFPVATSIGDYAFNACSALTSVSFPLVTSIGEYVFNAINSKLTTLYIGTESDTVCTLSNTNAIPSSVTDIYVPEALVDSYKTAPNWSNFADRIKAYTGEIV